MKNLIPAILFCFLFVGTSRAARTVVYENVTGKIVEIQEGGDASDFSRFDSQTYTVKRTTEDIKAEELLNKEIDLNTGVVIEKSESEKAAIANKSVYREIVNLKFNRYVWQQLQKEETCEDCLAVIAEYLLQIENEITKLQGKLVLNAIDAR